MWKKWGLGFIGSIFTDNNIVVYLFYYRSCNTTQEPHSVWTRQHTNPRAGSDIGKWFHTCILRLGIYTELLYFVPLCISYVKLQHINLLYTCNKDNVYHEIVSMLFAFSKWSLKLLIHWQHCISIACTSTSNFNFFCMVLSGLIC